MPPNWTDLLQRSSHIGVTDNIDLKDNYIKTPSHDPRAAPQKNNKMLMSLQSKPYAQESPPRKGASASEVHGHPASEGVRKTSNLKKLFFSKITQRAQCDAILLDR